MAPRHNLPAPLFLARFLILLALGAGAGYWLWSRSSRHESGPPLARDDVGRSAPFQSPSPEITRRFLQIEADQNQMDEKVWPTESLAEGHEDVFIRLWDELRAGDDAFAVLQRFAAGEILIGQPVLAAEHENGVREFRLDQAPEKVTPERRQAMLEEFKRAGYEVEQSEWRQPRFEPGPPAKSTIYVSTHIRNARANERLALRGNLEVEWNPAGGPGEPPRPRTIDATGLRLIRRQGDPAFQAVLSAVIEPDPGTIFVDPLILYDLDGDGRSEIILGCKNMVLRNRGQGRFDREILCPQLHGVINTAMIADFDGDGRADFLATDRDGLVLFAGDDRGRFPGPGLRVWSAPEPLLNAFVMTAGDTDGNGSLDVWLAQYKLPYVSGQMPTPYYDANDGFPAFLLSNDGHGRFRDVTQDAGLATKRFRRTYSSSLVDLDGDGDLDLVVVSDFAGADVYFNDGRGHFTDVTSTVLDEAHAFGMAHTFGDYDGDGRLDFLMIGMNSFVARRLDGLGLGPAGFPDFKAMRPRMGYGNRLYLARGTRFEQTALSGQIAFSGWSWGATTFDFDNDGDLDIYIVNGHKSRRSVKDYETQFWRHDIYAADSSLDPARDLYFQASAERCYGAGQSYGGYEKNRLFLNESGKAFLETGYLMGVSAEEDCRNVVSDDLDGDGRLDLLLTTFEEWPAKRQALHILQNRLERPGNWIGVRLREAPGKPSPLGAAVTLKTARGIQVRRMVSGDSYRSQHSNTAHFGIGAADRVESIEVRWLKGKTKTLLSPEINRYLAVDPD